MRELAIAIIKKVKIFRVTVSTDKMEYVVINDLNHRHIDTGYNPCRMAQDFTDAVQEVCDNQSED